MADKTDPRHVDRKAEEQRQQDVIDAVEKVTRDKDGNPVPIVAPEAEIPQPPGHRVFGGKP